LLSLDRLFHDRSNLSVTRRVDALQKLLAQN
jgi:hypothetical protein